MSAYDRLAFSYDALTYDIPYEAMLNFVEAILQERNLAPQTVLDLACGTGSMSLLLAQRGYQVTAVDLSEQMLTVASEKTMDLEENRPVFIQQAMQKLRLPYQVDLALCLLDSINYLTDPKQCQKTFLNVFQALNHNGVFIFDINSERKLKSLDGQIFLDETDESYCVWRAEFEESEHCLYYGMDLFQLEKDHWNRSFEEHKEYAYRVEELTAYLKEAGFQDVAVCGDCKLQPQAEQEQRIFFICSKE